MEKRLKNHIVPVDLVPYMMIQSCRTNTHQLSKHWKR